MAGGDDETFRFHHILVRDAAYQSLLKRARATLHERFVAWAEPVNRERGRETEFEEILGYHLEQAVRYRSELGPLDATGQEVADRASGKLASAGRRAFARGDTPAACSLLRRAAVLRPPDDPIRLELLTELADALSEEGEFDEAATSLRDAIDSAERIGDARLRDRARLAERGLELSTSGGAGIADVVGEAERSIASFEAAGDEAGLARAWRLLMLVHGTAGRYDQAAVAAEQVARHARAAGDVLLATRGSLGYAASALHGPTPVDDAIATGQRLADEVSGDRKAEAIMLGVLGQLHAMAGNFDEARDRARRGLAMLLELGPSITASSTSIESSRIETLAGDAEAARAALQRDYDALEAVGETYYRASIAGLLAHALVDTGDLDGAERVAALARDIGDDDDAEVQILWRSAQARVLAARSRAGEAIPLAEAALEIADSTVDLVLQADVLAVLAEVLDAAGNPSGGDVARARALALYEQKGSRAGRARLLDHRPEATTRLT
jgi:tetratricopeptide (TPR) repeat protein